MSYEKSVSDHYLHGELLKAIEVSLPLLGKTTSTVTIEDLAPVDEFHTGGQAATNHLLEQLGFLEHSLVLDVGCWMWGVGCGVWGVGCGLGGAARYVATKSDIHVTGIDLTAEYVETGKVLCRWLNLQDRVILKQGSALSMPFESRQFDGGYMLHVGMNIDDKQALFSEVARVLKPGAAFGVYDVMLLSEGEILYPVPWATDSGTSKLASPDEYKQALCNAGFTIASKNSRRDFALEFFKRIKSNNESSGGPPPLGLHTLMQQSTAQKIQNLMTNITSERLAPVEMIAIKN